MRKITSLNPDWQFTKENRTETVNAISRFI